MAGQIFYKGTRVETIPDSAYAEWESRLSLAWSRYFAAHPEEYENFIANHGATISEKKDLVAPPTKS